MQLFVLIDVVGVNDVRMIEGGNGPGFPVEALQGGIIAGLGRRQHLDGDAAAHELVFAEVDRPHAAGAELFEHFVLADREASPLALQDLLGLELREDAVADEVAGHARGIAAHAAVGASFLQIIGQTPLVRDAALANEIEEFVRADRRSHRLTLTARPPRADRTQKLRQTHKSSILSQLRGVGKIAEAQGAAHSAVIAGRPADEQELTTESQRTQSIAARHGGAEEKAESHSGKPGHS